MVLDKPSKMLIAKRVSLRTQKKDEIDSNDKIIDLVDETIKKYHPRLLFIREDLKSLIIVLKRNGKKLLGLKNKNLTITEIEENHVTRLSIVLWHKTLEDKNKAYLPVEDYIAIYLPYDSTAEPRKDANTSQKWFLDHVNNPNISDEKHPVSPLLSKSDIKNIKRSSHKVNLCAFIYQLMDNLSQERKNSTNSKILTHKSNVDDHLYGAIKEPEKIDTFSDLLEYLNELDASRENLASFVGFNVEH